MNDVINHENGNCIWYHTTPNDRVDIIFKKGLKINSEPSWQSYPEPWIYISTIPWIDDNENATVFKVDLSFINKDDCGWAFADNDSPKEELWQLRVFRDIPSKYLEIYNTIK